jgi:O-antigen ligase
MVNSFLESRAFADIGWRGGFAIFLLAAMARSFVVVNSLDDEVLTAVQFGAIGIALVSVLISRIDATMRRVDVLIAFALALLLLVAILSSIFGIRPSVSLPQCAIFALIAAFLIATSLKRWVSPRIVRGDLTTLFTIVCLAQAAGLVGFLAGAHWASGGYDRFIGCFTNANYAGIASAVTAPLVFYLASGRGPLLRSAFWAGLLVLAAALWFSESRGSLIAFVAGLAVSFMIRMHRRWVTAVTLVAAAVVSGVVVVISFALRSEVVNVKLDPAAASITSGRLDIYGTIIHAWSKRPILGTGYRTTPEITGGLQAHNVYLSMLTETGIIGALCFVLWVVLIVLGGARGPRTALTFGAVVAVAVSEITESSLFGFGAPTALLAWVAIMAYASLGKFDAPRPAPKWHPARRIYRLIGLNASSVAIHEPQPVSHEDSTTPVTG